MATYLVREENMERLEKKLAAIEKKCAAAHCSFTYEIKGEQYNEVKDEDGNVYTAKYIEVEVEGEAKYQGWSFVATIDHHEAGNVIRAYNTELTIPEKYKTCGPTCEHCKKIRSRKDTYLIYNEENNEFKQVGKSCLQEFTNGLSAEDVAFFCSIYEKVEDAGSYSGPNFNKYIEVEAILPYAFECFKHWGYQKSRNSYAEENGYVPDGYRTTSERVTSYYYINRASSKVREELKAEMDAVGFNADSEYAVESTKNALEWIRNIDEKELNSNEYIRNLHVICSDKYTDYRSLGILVSLTTAYERHLGKIAAYEKKENAHKAEVLASAHVGEVGDKIEVNVASFTCVSSWESMYGVTFLYKFTDAENHTFIWYASKSVDNEDRVTTIKGTVKDHSEFNGVKQTVLTRCKVTAYRPEEEEVHEPATNNVQDGLDAFFEAIES